MAVTLFRLSVVLVAALGLIACSDGDDPAPPPVPPPSYTVGGNVSGLAGSGLVLQNNGADNQTVAANGSFVFSSAVQSGSGYDVRVLTQPSSPSQHCEVTNGSGVMGNAAVTAPAIACVTPIPRFAYSLDFGNASLSLYAVDTNGQLRPRGHVRTGSNPIGSLLTPDHRYLYVLGRGTAQLSAFARNAVTGELIEVAGSPYATGGIAGGEGVGPGSISMHPNGRFIYVANSGGTDNIAAFAIDNTTGALTAVPGSPFAAGDLPTAITFDASGTYGYATSQGTNQILVYSVNATTGALTLNTSQTTSTGAIPGVLFIHANRRFAYVPNSSDGTITAFTVNPTTGALGAIPGSPFVSGANPAFGVYFHPSGRFLYLRNAGLQDSSGTLSAFSIHQATGALTPIGTPQAIPANSNRLVFDPAGKFIMTVNRGTPLNVASSGSITMFSVDATTGALTALTGLPSVQPAPYMASMDQSGRFLYVSSLTGNLHLTYTLDSTTGALTPLSTGFAVAARNQTLGVFAWSLPGAPAAPTFSSQFAYVANSIDNTISSYSINPTTGALTAQTPTPSADAGPSALAIQPGNRFLLGSYTNGSIGSSSGVGTHGINATTGVLAASSGNQLVGPGVGPASLALNANGRSVFVANLPSTTIRAYTIGASGALAPTGGTTFHGTVFPTTDIGTNAVGRFLYFLTTQNVGWRTIDDTTGGFAGGSSSGSSAVNRSALAFDPSGRFAYAAVATAPSGSIEVRPINAGTGSFIAISQTAATGSMPQSIAVDPTGRFLYTANSGSNDLSTFTINQVTGALTEVTPRIAAGTNPIAIRADYSGKFVYAISRDTNQLLAYSINQTTGALSPLGSVPVATGAGATYLTLSQDVQ